LRHLRVLLSVVDTGSVTKASIACNVSQPAVTQALQKLERQFGTTLFERTNQGVFPNMLAQLLAERVRRAFQLLDSAVEQISSRGPLTATTAKLRALIALRSEEHTS